MHKFSTKTTGPSFGNGISSNASSWPLYDFSSCFFWDAFNGMEFLGRCFAFSGVYCSLFFGANSRETTFISLRSSIGIPRFGYRETNLPGSKWGCLNVEKEAANPCEVVKQMFRSNPAGENVAQPKPPSALRRCWWWVWVDACGRAGWMDHEPDLELALWRWRGGSSSPALGKGCRKNGGENEMGGIFGCSKSSGCFFL